VGQARRQRQAERSSGKVFIAYLHPGMVSGYFHESLMATVMWDMSGPRRIANLMQEWSSANISAARNTLVQRFLKHSSDAEWLLFIDSDMQWDHDTVDRMLAVADPESVPILGGLCFGAAHGRLFPTLYTLTRRDEKLTCVRAVDYPRDQLVSCDATGAAFLLIHRSVLVAMHERQFNKTFPWFMEQELDGDPVGEDIAFCLRARQMGYPIHVHTGIKVGHHKSLLYTEAMFDAQAPWEGEPRD